MTVGDARQRQRRIRQLIANVGTVRLSPLVEIALMLDSSGVASLDLTTLARIYQTGTVSPEEVLASVMRRMAAFKARAVWIYCLPPDDVRAQVKALTRRRAAGQCLPLYGVPFAVKDNIDVAGYPTSAGCPAFIYTAKETASVVTRLLDAGAILVGKANLDQFASGLAGDRSPLGPCSNVFRPEYISGGSSSGSAVAVAAGLVSFALGTDTAGSGRVPAACNNIVGLKPTLGLLPTDGLVPACRSLDCVSLLALTVADAWRVFTVASGEMLTGFAPPRAAELDGKPDGWLFGVPREEDMEFCGDADQARLFTQAVERLERMGGRKLKVDLRPLRQAASLLYEGPWLAERLAALEPFISEHEDDVLPVTRTVLKGGARYSAVEVFQGFAQLQRLQQQCAEVFQEARVLVVPTIPTLPTVAEVQADSVRWSRRLGYYTNFVNLLGWSALAVPAGFTPRGLPGGLTLIGPGGSDRQLAALGMAWQRRINLSMGATGQFLPEEPRPSPGVQPLRPAEGFVRVAVAGAHLRGQPLHPDLQRTGARFVRACRTASDYRFVALLHLHPPRPGLLREAGRAGAIAVEIYDLPMEGFGKLVASVAPPLAIGTITLEDGEAVKGFLCESWAAAVGRDITEFGGWLAFLERQRSSVCHGGNP
jgi:allophanate hydrolase